MTKIVLYPTPATLSKSVLWYIKRKRKKKRKEKKRKKEREKEREKERKGERKEGRFMCVFATIDKYLLR